VALTFAIFLKILLKKINHRREKSFKNAFNSGLTIGPFFLPLDESSPGK
jgi:hypothetical protein